MNTKKRDFDKEANSWDDDPLRVKLANDIFRCISREIVLLPRMDVMDYGCGTGLLTLQFHPLVRSITGFDSSEGMLNVFRKKVKDKNLSRVEAHHINLDAQATVNGQYHLITSNMTLHHVKNIQPLLHQFYKVLQPSGHLCITDLDTDDGKFHDNNDGVFHQGFDRSVLQKFYKKTGFVDIRDIKATEIRKTGRDGIERNFSVFLMIGRKG